MKKKLRKGVFFVVYSVKNGNPIYLLLKRKVHWIGWEFPKAGVEKYETKRHAVKRETKEETGLTPIKIKEYSYKGKYIYQKRFKDRIGYFGQTSSLYSAEVKYGKVRLDKKEHSDFIWVNYKNALKKLTHKNQKKSLKIVKDYLQNN